MGDSMADNDGKKAGSQFDQYELIGLIIPGAIFISGVAVILGNFSLISAVKEISVGGLGLLAILAYVTGLQAVLHIEVTLPNGTMSRKESYGLTRRIYVAVAAAGRSTRADAFNRTYGLLRGLTAAFVLLAVVAAVHTNSPIEVGNGMKVCSLYISLFLLACGVGAFYRMTHFGLTYARELFVQFLQT